SAAKARLLRYDLTTPRTPQWLGAPSPTQLVVLDPSALAALDSERIQTLSASGAYASVPDAQWSDALPKLVQVTLLRRLEDAGRFSGVTRPLEGTTSDIQLVLDIRKFQISPNLSAEVEIGCKLVGSNGRIMTTRTRASAPVEGQGAPARLSPWTRPSGAR